MIINIPRAVHSKQEDHVKGVIYLRRAQSSLEALRYPCDCPSRFLYDAMSYLSAIPGSGVDIHAYDYLYSSDADTLDSKVVDEAWEIFHKLEKKVEKDSYF